MISLLSTPHEQLPSLLSLLPFSIPRGIPSADGPSSSTEVFSLRSYLESLTSIAVVTVRAYAHYAAKLVPHEWAEKLEGVVPTELSKLVKALLAEDMVIYNKVEPLRKDESDVILIHTNACDHVSDDKVEIPESVTDNVEKSRSIVTKEVEDGSECVLGSRIFAEKPSGTITMSTDAIAETNKPQIKNQEILPRFYSPHKTRSTAQLERLIKSLKSHLGLNPDSQNRVISEPEFFKVTDICGLPTYLNRTFMCKVSQCCSCKNSTKATGDTYSDSSDSEDDSMITWSDFERVFRKLYVDYDGDIDSVMFGILLPTGRKRTYLVPADFEAVVRDVIATHRSFDFLRSSPVFQDRYAETVIARIFYMKPNAMNGRMTLREYRKIKFLDMLKGVQKASGCLGLAMPPAFSYKDFYVIYCRFWELDTDRDMLLTASDLEKYGEGALTKITCRRAVDLYGSRVISQSVPNSDGGSEYTVEQKALTFTDFVSFIMSAEDKMTPTAIEYWFHVLDLDQDNSLSLLELETVWAWQKNRVADFEAYTLLDFVNVVMDTLNFRSPSPVLTLRHLKQNPAAAEMIYNLIFDARRREEWVRRTCDASYRLSEEVWVDVEAGEGIWWEFEQWGVRRVEGNCLRVKLEGWAKFADSAYRELLGAETTDEEEDDGSEISSEVSREGDMELSMW